MAEKRRIVGEGLFRKLAEKWRVVDVDALIDELDPAVSLTENWELFRAALARRGIYPEPKVWSREEEKARYLSWLDDEVRRSGLLDELYEKIEELSKELIERDLALGSLEQERRRLEEAWKELKITEKEYEWKKGALSRFEQQLKNWSEELARVQFRIPVVTAKEAGEELERVQKVKPKLLTKDEESRLRDEFKVYLTRVLGRVPRDAMAEFRLELDAAKILPYEEALKVVTKLADDIIAREVKPPPPVVKPPPPVAPWNHTEMMKLWWEIRPIFEATGIDPALYREEAFGIMAVQPTPDDARRVLRAWAEDTVRRLVVAVPPPVVFVPEEVKWLTKEEEKAVLSELEVSTFNQALEKVLAGELPAEKVKKVYDLLMKLRKARS